MVGFQQIQVETSTIPAMPYNTTRTRSMNIILKQFKNKEPKKKRIDLRPPGPY